MLDAGGQCLDKRYLDQRQPGQKWSALIFPVEKPPQGHLCIWRDCLCSLAPCGRADQCVGVYKSKGYKIWDWHYDEETSRVYHHRGHVMEIYTLSMVPQSTRCSNCWTRLQIGTLLEEKGEYCTVKELGLGVYAVILHTPRPQEAMEPTSFWGVVKSWGNTWLWDNLKTTGDIGWIAVSIWDNSLLAIIDGSHMKELYPNINSAAFVLECTKGRGRLMGSFVKHTKDACGYRGELLGLMAIHLILLNINKCNPGLPGSAQIFSDCLGALNKVENLPPCRIPTRCSHSDILKNIMVHCSDLSFRHLYSYVKAHQDDNIRYGDLTRPAQLNCQMDYHAKNQSGMQVQQMTRLLDGFRLSQSVYFLGGEISSHRIRGRRYHFGSIGKLRERPFINSTSYMRIPSTRWIGNVYTPAYGVLRLFFRSGGVNR